MPRRVPTALALLAAPLLLLAACGEEDTGGRATAEPTGDPCVFAEAEAPAKEVEPPPDRATHDGTVPAVLATSAGDLEVELDADGAPCTVTSFVSLAEQGYFDGTQCHRLTTAGIYVLQCGDPTATGTGGPGYTVPDEAEGDEEYPAGTLAMARTPMPDSGGSQFFVVYADTGLPPEYTVFGTLTAESVALVRDVANGGTDDAFGPGDGHPRTPVEIESVTVEAG